MAVAVRPSQLRPLTGAVLTAGTDRAGLIAAAHARALGARVVRGAPGVVALESHGDTAVSCRIELEPEEIAQARSGLMALHGRDAGRPRRLGLAVASVATGLNAVQSLLAMLLARSRGSSIATARTSSLDGALAFLAHHLAIASSGDRLHPDPGAADGRGPPFPTSDGHWVELEALSGGSWEKFWDRLGVPKSVAHAAWSPFVLRYLAGACRLPPALHEATRTHPLATLREAAVASDLVLCPLRGDAGSPSPEPWDLTPAELPGALMLLPTPPQAPVGGPLAGLRVVELATRLQGPLVGQLLGLMGAAVTKVEPPGGDIGRAARAGFGFAAYRAYNRGKKVIELDIKTARGRAELHELVVGADVFVHNSPPGRAEQLGYDRETLARLSPVLVYAHASGWGPRGPARIAGDFLVQAHAGLGRLLNPPGEAPFPSRVTLLDVAGGLLACEAILAGLFAREQTGNGCAVATSLLGAAAELRRHGCGIRWGPLDVPLQTADGYLVVAAGTDAARRRTAAVCALAPDADDGAIADRLRARPAAEQVRALSDVGVAAAVCGDVSQAAADEAIAAHLDQLDGSLLVPGAPWRFGAMT